MLFCSGFLATEYSTGYSNCSEECFKDEPNKEGRMMLCV